MTATIAAAQQIAIPSQAPGLAATEIAKQVGPHDTASARAVMAVCEALPLGSTHRQAAAERRRGLKSLLRWLESFPGNGWAQRWQAAGADDGERWLQDRIAGDHRGRSAAREELNRGLGALLLGRIVLPGYGFLAEYKGRAVYDLLPQTISTDGFARLERHASDLKITARHLDEARMILCRIILHTGRDLEQLTESDVLGFREWFKRRDGRTKFGLHGAWDLLVAFGVLPVGSTLSKVSRMGQRSAAELVARHNIQCAPVRDLLIRYLDERRPALDYGTFQGLTGLLAGTFWADLETHHQGLDSIDLPAAVASAWKQRLRTVSNPDGSTRERRGYLDVLIRVRSFYLDLQEWALQDPSWAQWAVPCPIRKSDTAGLLKARRKVIAEVHQRTRERLPYLAVLVDAADRHRREQTSLLNAAAKTAMHTEFTHDGTQYRRAMHKSYAAGLAVAPGEIVIAEDLASGKRLNLSKAESDAFWAWAAIEVLRHTAYASRSCWRSPTWR